MLDWLPEFLDGLFLMLADENRELRQVSWQAGRQAHTHLHTHTFTHTHTCTHIHTHNYSHSQAAGSCLEEFLRGIRSNVDAVDFGAMVPILVHQCDAKDVSKSIYIYICVCVCVRTCVCVCVCVDWRRAVPRSFLSGGTGV